MSKFHVFCLLVLFSGSVLLPVKSHAQLKNYQFEQIDSLQNIQKRKIIVFIHTDWCKFCSAMKNTTFKNKEVITLLNNQYYFIDLNAEEKKTIYFQGKNYEFKPTGNQTGINDLVKALATINGAISYPTLCVLNDKNEIVFQHNSFLNSDALLQILNALN